MDYTDSYTSSLEEIVHDRLCEGSLNHLPFVKRMVELMRNLPTLQVRLVPLEENPNPKWQKWQLVCQK